MKLKNRPGCRCCPEKPKRTRPVHVTRSFCGGPWADYLEGVTLTGPNGYSETKYGPPTLNQCGFPSKLINSWVFRVADPGDYTAVSIGSPPRHLPAESTKTIGLPWVDDCVGNVIPLNFAIESGYVCPPCSATVNGVVKPYQPIPKTLHGSDSFYGPFTLSYDDALGYYRAVVSRPHPGCPNLSIEITYTYRSCYFAVEGRVVDPNFSCTGSYTVGWSCPPVEPPAGPGLSMIPLYLRFLPVTWSHSPSIGRGLLYNDPDIASSKVYSVTITE